MIIFIGCLYRAVVHLRTHHGRPGRLLPGLCPDRRHRPHHHPDSDHLRRADHLPAARHPALHAGRQPDERGRPHAGPGELRPHAARAHPRRAGACHDPGLRHLRGHLRGRRGHGGRHRGRHDPGHEEGGLRRGCGGGPDLHGLLPGARSSRPASRSSSTASRPTSPSPGCSWAVCSPASCWRAP